MDTWTLRISRLGYPIATALTVAACGVAIALLQLPQLRELNQQGATLSPEDIRRDVEAEQLRLGLLQKLPSLGYDNLIADFTFLNFLQYFGDTPARTQTDYTLSPDYFAVIIPRNPRFIQAYTFLSTSTAIYAAQPQRSIALMEQGLQSLSPDLPRSYFVWRNKAIDQLLFLGDSEGARQSFETAAQWALASSEPGSEAIARSSRQTAQFLTNNPDSKTAQVAAWMMVLSSVPDDRTRRIAIDNIQLLGGRIVQNQDGSFSIAPPAQD